MNQLDLKSLEDSLREKLDDVVNEILDEIREQEHGKIECSDCEEEYDKLKDELEG